MGLRREMVVATSLLSLMAMVSGYLPPSFFSPDGYMTGCGATATTAVATCSTGTAVPPPRRQAYTRLSLNKEDLPDESIRQIAAANQRVKDLEEEYWKSLDADEIAIERKCASGLACLKAPGMLEKAAEYYTSASELRCVMMTGAVYLQFGVGWSEKGHLYVRRSTSFVKACR